MMLITMPAQLTMCPQVTSYLAMCFTRVKGEVVDWSKPVSSRCTTRGVPTTRQLIPLQSMPTRKHASRTEVWYRAGCKAGIGWQLKCVGRMDIEKGRA